MKKNLDSRLCRANNEPKKKTNDFIDLTILFFFYAQNLSKRFLIDQIFELE